jgi:ABC-2 type transport system permease protein/ribosome-dependent ATPase
MNLHRAASVAYKEWREIVRDKLLLSLAFVMPAVMMILIGFGMVMDVKNIPLGIVDRDGSAMSRDLAYRFMSSQYFDFKGYLYDDREAGRMLTEGRLRAVVEIPEHFERDVQAGRPAAVQTLLDGTYPHAATIVKAYVDAISAGTGVDLLTQRLAAEYGITEEDALELLEPFRVEVRYLYNESLKSDWSFPPKMIMMILFFAPAFMTSIRVVREKETGSIYNMYASSVTRGEFLLGKLAPYEAIFLINGLILWAIGISVFGAPFRGSLVLFLLATALFVVISACLGALVASFVRTQMAAMVIAMFVTFIAAAQYAGLSIPVSSLRPQAQLIAHLVGAMHYTRITDGTFLKGVGLRVLWPDMLILASYATALFALCYVRFRKRVPR